MTEEASVIDFDAPPPPRRAARFKALESRLLSIVIRRDDGGRVVSPGLLQRLLALLYLSGATIGLVSMAFPQPPGTSVPGLFAVYGVAYAVGALLWLMRERVHPWVPEVGLAFGTVLITLAIHFTEARTGVYSMFYVWVSISAFYFLPWERAFLQIAMVGAAFAAVLISESPEAGAEEWIITAGTVTVAGLFVGALRRGVERLIANLEEAARTDHARLYAAERAARLEADRASESLRRLQQVTDVALSHLELEELLNELLARVKQVLAVDVAAVMLLEEADVLNVRAALGLEESSWRGLSIPVGEGFGGRIAAGRRLMVVRGKEETRAVSPALNDLGLCALMGAPLVTEAKVIGVIHVGSFTDREFDDEEKRLLSLVADRAALAISHARLYEREHGIAETLQRSLLPRSLPAVPGARVAARYLPARAEARVGGDWYDVVPLNGGGVGLTIGDVSGHGVEAASLMGSLRDGLRAAALEGEDVARATERVDRLLLSQRGGGDAIATVLFAVLRPDGSHLDFTSAGHPPPLVLRPDGSAEFLDGGLSTPLGVLANGSRPTAGVDLEPGSLLVLYTDGLVERRDASIDVGMERLADAARGADRDPERFCDAVLRAMLGSEGPADDVALLAVATRS
ncbi:MAG: PP2C family protein-serine/threonine phosphatase [Thermoleophilaceae bacterium]